MPKPVLSDNRWRRKARLWQAERHQPGMRLRRLRLKRMLEAVIGAQPQRELRGWEGSPPEYQGLINIAGQVYYLDSWQKV